MGSGASRVLGGLTRLEQLELQGSKGWGSVMASQLGRTIIKNSAELDEAIASGETRLLLMDGPTYMMKGLDRDLASPSAAYNPWPAGLDIMGVCKPTDFLNSKQDGVMLDFAYPDSDCLECDYAAATNVTLSAAVDMGGDCVYVTASDASNIEVGDYFGWPDSQSDEIVNIVDGTELYLKYGNFDAYADLTPSGCFVCKRADMFMAKGGFSNLAMMTSAATMLTDAHSVVDFHIENVDMGDGFYDFMWNNYCVDMRLRNIQWSPLGTKSIGDAPIGYYRSYGENWIEQNVGTIMENVSLMTEGSYSVWWLTGNLGATIRNVRNSDDLNLRDSGNCVIEHFGTGWGTLDLRGSANITILGGRYWNAQVGGHSNASALILGSRFCGTGNLSISGLAGGVANFVGCSWPKASSVQATSVCKVSFDGCHAAEGEIRNGVVLPQCAIANLPPAANNSGKFIMTSNGGGGSMMPAFSDGTNWLRVDTGAAVS